MQQALFFLVLLFIAEVAAMLALDELFITSDFFWLESFFDASLMAVATTFIVHIFCRLKLFKIHNPRGLESVYFQSGMLAFAVTAGLMLTFSLFSVEHTFNIILIDAALFSTLTTALFYLFILKGQTIKSKPEPDKAISLIVFKHMGSYFFAILLLALLLLNIYNQQFKSHVQQVIDRETLQLSITEETLRNLIANTVLDAIVLSQQHDTVSFLSSSEKTSQKLALDYLNLATAKPSYEQIRLIDNTGMERIRINRNKLDKPILVPQNELQNKKSRYYFTKTMKLSPAEFYISPLDLNIEHGEIEQPYKPIVRVASPISASGKHQGIIIFNLSAQKILSYLDKQEKASNGQLMLLNSDNYWLHGGGNSQWAFMFPGREEDNFSHQYPQVTQELKKRDAGYIESEHGYFIFTSVYTGKNLTPFVNVSSGENNWPTWKLISYISTENMSEKLNTFSNLIHPFFILIVFVTAAGASMYTYSRTRHMKSELQIKHMAEHDTLTGLRNRRLFVSLLDQEIIQQQISKTPIALMYLDLDRFKPVNDQFGHEMGDQVLIQTAQRIQKCLRKPDTLARLGGDEFAILLSEVEHVDSVILIAERILQEIQAPYIWNEHEVTIGISIGIIYAESDQYDRHQLLNIADKTMYQAKSNGRNNYCLSKV